MFYFLKKKFSSGKKTIFLTWAFPYWGDGGGVCPRGKNSHVISFFSEGSPYLAVVVVVQSFDSGDFFLCNRRFSGEVGDTGLC